jgi:hypothetical protein
MSFYASGDRIRVTNSSNDEIFDTDTPMPHILQTLTQNVTHTFPDTGRTVSGAIYNFINSFNCSYFYYDSCATTYTYYDSCAWSFDSYDSCATSSYNFYYGQTECYGGFVTNCYGGFVDECNGGFVTEYNDEYFSDCTSYHSASDSSSTYDIGTLTSGVTPDFLIVVANGSRTSGGSDYQFGSFITAIPTSANFPASGSTILESSFQGGGASWLRRICSVYVDGDTVKVEFKHSNAGRVSGFYTDSSCFIYPSCFSTGSSISSAFDIDFTVYAGKFTQ